MKQIPRIHTKWHSAHTHIRTHSHHTHSQCHTMSQDNVYPVLDVQQLFSGQARPKASFSNNGLSPCQQKRCQPRCQLGTGPRVSSGWFKGIKAQCWGGGGVPPEFALKQPVVHRSLLTSPPLVLSAWAGSIYNPSSENLLCMHRSIGHALMFHIHSQAAHETRASSISPQVSFKGGHWTARVRCTLIKDWWSRRDNNIFVDLVNWCLPLATLN